MLLSHYLDYCSFIVNFEMRWCETSNFVLFLKIVLEEFPGSQMVRILPFPCQGTGFNPARQDQKSKQTNKKWGWGGGVEIVLVVLITFHLPYTLRISLSVYIKILVGVITQIVLKL